MQLVLDQVAQQVGGDTWLYPMRLTLQSNVVSVLLGATQAGKTSLMRIMAGLDAPTQGHAWVDGCDVTGVPVRQRNVAMVYQQFINDPSMTGAQNIASPLKLRGDPDIDRKVRSLAERLQIDPFLDRLPAAWRYAQFFTAKTASLKKTIVGLTPIRESDIQSKAMGDLAPKLGGLVKVYLSPARVARTPAGNNVPDYPKLAQLWWKNVAQAVTGEKTPQVDMDTLAEEMDPVMARLQRAGMAQCAPKLNPKSDPAKWLSDSHAPWKKLANEKPKGETIAYDNLLNAWENGKALSTPCSEPLAPRQAPPCGVLGCQGVINFARIST